MSSEKVSRDLVVIFITTGTEQEAESISRALVERRKVACVNTVPVVRSFFWWQGGPDSAEEVLLVAKTQASLVPGVVEVVREIHSYDVPEVIALPIMGGNEDYLKWVVDETEGS
ncbi:MAG: divalent-cation tolerance protein CutA [Dehalococcoidales bacterium]|nr:MAG: divalent-cation tolerance protein CutA [Dehalococcoidales bacterium]